MDKYDRFMQTLRIICILCWTGLIIIVALCPEYNCRVGFFGAAGLLVVENIIEFILWRYDNAWKIKRPDNES